MIIIKPLRRGTQNNFKQYPKADHAMETWITRTKYCLQCCIQFNCVTRRYITMIAVDQGCEFRTVKLCSIINLIGTDFKTQRWADNFLTNWDH